MIENDTLGARLARRIADEGSISLGDYMAAANAHYYAIRDPLGTTGDFVTAPEISQMFGEFVGAWLADLWFRAAPLAEPVYVELGPGRGTLAADALRVLAKAGLGPRVDLVETSPTLRRAQAAAVPGARWHDGVDTLPRDAPLLVVANEFFDALPIRQFVRTPDGWRERLVSASVAGFAPVLGTVDASNHVPRALRDSPPGSVWETCPDALVVVRALADLIAEQGGAMLVIDYGHAQSAFGDTLQAVRGHAYADVFASPGEHDLTAHVDFAALARAAAPLRVHGPAAQGDWLRALGLDARAATLARADPRRGTEVLAAHERLAGPAQMGELFKVMALVEPGWPVPEGFK